MVGGDDKGHYRALDHSFRNFTYRLQNTYIRILHRVILITEFEILNETTMSTPVDSIAIRSTVEAHDAQGYEDPMPCPWIKSCWGKRNADGKTEGSYARDWKSVRWIVATTVVTWSTLLWGGREGGREGPGGEGIVHSPWYSFFLSFFDVYRVVLSVGLRTHTSYIPPKEEECLGGGFNHHPAQCQRSTLKARLLSVTGRDVRGKRGDAE